MTEQSTDKQISFAKQLGIANPETFSKGVLRELIQNKLAEDDGNNIDRVPLKPGFAPKAFIPPAKPVKEFHLSPEQVNTNALNAAIEISSEKLADDGLIRVAQRFKEFIENGN